MKLLNKSLRLYLVYAVAIFLVAIPVFYFAIESIISEDVDENLAAQKREILIKLEKQSKSSSDILLEIISTDFEIRPLANFQKTDTFYTMQQYDSISDESLPYRVMESNVLVKSSPYKLKLKNSLIDTEDLKERIVLLVGILLLCIIIGLYTITIYISKKTWEPFYKTLEKLHHFRVDKNEPIQLSSTNVNEFADLNNAIANLANTNQQVYQSQKEFTENASHEMQTPLAVFQGKLDLLMQTMPLTQEQSELISDMTEVNHRINRLNKSLLLLTKIENNQFADVESVSVKKILEKLTEQYRFHTEQQNIAINNILAEDIVVVANKMLIEIMLGNLLSNAIKHNFSNGSVIIEGNNTDIIFSNTGTETLLNADKIFQRFHKQTTDSASIGLGLQIAKKIADNYNFTIVYLFQNNYHCFILKF